MLSARYIRSLSGDVECLEAMAWLAEHGHKYPVGKFTPPLVSKRSPAKDVRFLALAARLSSIGRSSGQKRVSRLDWCDGDAVGSCDGSDDDIAAGFASRVLRSGSSGSLLVLTGQRRGALDIWLSSQGPSLLSLGYTLRPFAVGGAIIFVSIRRGHRAWKLTYWETMTGCEPSIVDSIARHVGSTTPNSSSRVAGLYAAIGGVSAFLRHHFGSALHPTAGMIAMECVRRALPDNFQKWRPDPLLVAMERQGGGYRGGMTHAVRYRGSTWRLDVNRQYTHALRSELPLRAHFGRYQDAQRTPHGVFVCRVRFGNSIPYPVAVWGGIDSGFRRATVVGNTYVCILHTAEFPGILASGATISPQWGFVYSATFSLASYVERIQSILHTYGKDSAFGKLTKPLGNYVYGKFAQAPSRTELLYSLADPGKEWFPFWDDTGEAWPQIWERTTIRHTGSQHVDIAATITSAARSQTAQTWALLSALGVGVVRCHTDSLTLTEDVSSRFSVQSEDIGRWRSEGYTEDSIIVGPNWFTDQDGPHIAGIIEPTREMIERMHDGESVEIDQDVNEPRRGFVRGSRAIKRVLQA
jgi:hypothetical protein